MSELIKVFKSPKVPYCPLDSFLKSDKEFLQSVPDIYLYLKWLISAIPRFSVEGLPKTFCLFCTDLVAN